MGKLQAAEIDIQNNLNNDKTVNYNNKTQTHTKRPAGSREANPSWNSALQIEMSYVFGFWFYFGFVLQDGDKTNIKSRNKRTDNFNVSWHT